MNYSLDKYKFYEYNDPKGKKTVSAVSTYAGRTVKGYAKCDPRDSFNVEMVRSSRPRVAMRRFPQSV